MSPKNGLLSLWQSYKYRFVPWLVLNLKNRTMRRVEGGTSDKVIDDEEALRQVTQLTRALVTTFSRPIGERHTGERFESFKFVPNKSTKNSSDFKRDSWLKENMHTGKNTNAFTCGNKPMRDQHSEDDESYEHKMKSADRRLHQPTPLGMTFGSNLGDGTKISTLNTHSSSPGGQLSDSNFVKLSAANQETRILDCDLNGRVDRRNEIREENNINTDANSTISKACSNSSDFNKNCHNNIDLSRKSGTQNCDSNGTSDHCESALQRSPMVDKNNNSQPTNSAIDIIEDLSTAGHHHMDAYERCLVPPKPSNHVYEIAMQVSDEVLGHHVEKCSSAVGGIGVKISHVSGGDTLPPGRVVALYPGALYLPQQAVMLQSFGNPFMFRCIDGVLLDGSDRALSRMIFRSCVGRDLVGPSPLADVTWITDYPSNPMNVGQYVNNQNKAHPSNVAYQEVTVAATDNITLPERAYLPNIWYQPPMDTAVHDVPLRLVVLVTTKPVKEGEELFSDYFTIIT